ncbi:MULTISPECIES: TAXI family TRAP transporter solute-binding subunit [unclassified Paenibacillus]|uniref:TAXI family TRAP transporter solute-binding subunit n=1 Tax=unclassified Paenibacillus TaxID=185978 RepID=UPI001AE22D25|nr:MULTISPECIES: TAXI family TRAP transporter solute-binding subunit [unclassified Paenibacillus]MBP1156079.1 TRAP transporter TAXI family solute receptor [Paenibacillus sp. PvP091]MBP1168535.1 TRAP transporter TAXI family solute receptor [Paenibacillus sp. PvR098]MBP2439563.1 TRAP transporter TAXI family solute receptor [Paenibacillus sp. PvP052]
MVKKMVYPSFIFLLLVSLVAACSNSTSSRPLSDSNTPNAKKEEQATAVRIGTSSSGSPFYVLSVGMSEIIKKHTNMNATVEPVGGSDPNVFAIEAGKVDLAMLTAYSASKGYYGEDPFKKPVDLKLLAQGQKSLRQVVVTKKSGIKKPEDLAGKSIIAKRPALPEIELVANALFDAYSIPKDKVKIISTAETKEAVEALNLGSVDAAILPAGLGAADLMQLLQEGKVEFLSIDKDKQTEMLKSLPKSIFTTVIPANTYKNQEQDINVFAFNANLVASSSLSEQTVYEITKAVLGNTEEYKKVHKEAAEWTVENSLKAPSLPFHPGAIKYYKEIGKWDGKLDELQKSLEAK